MSKIYKIAGIVGGILFLLTTHLYRQVEIPGIHFDEAWAMNYSWRIAFEQGFWPLKAMSPYTAPWAHYCAALFLRIFGPSLEVFRLSQSFLSLLGMTLLAFALPRKVRPALSWGILLMPGILLNHRFAIELTGFHTLCFGALAWSLSRQRYALAFLALFLGTTSHILFYAVALALLATISGEKNGLEPRPRWFFSLYFGSIAVFFLQVLLQIPEKGKAGALLASALLSLLFLALKAERLSLWKAPRLWILLQILSVPFLFNSVFFAQGFWGAALFTGYDPPNLPFATLFFTIGLLALLFALYRGVKASPVFLQRFTVLLTLFLGLMMLKPAPRYFELSMLCFAAILAWDLHEWIFLWEWPLSARLHRLTFFAGLLAINIGFTLALVLQLSPVEKELRFLFFKDSSRDFLDKQKLAGFLGSSGCGPSDIGTGDSRIAEELKALSYRNWPKKEGINCRWKSVQRRADSRIGEGEDFGEFRLQSR